MTARYSSAKIPAGFLMLLFLFIHASAQSKSEVPFKTLRSLILVTVLLDGHSKTLIFDTGAEHTIINDRRNVMISAELRIGKVVVLNCPVAMADMSNEQQQAFSAVHADGVLGQDILRRFKNVRVNYSTNTITLER